MDWQARYGLVPRQTQTQSAPVPSPTEHCDTGLGQAECLPRGTCPGIVYQNQCSGTGTECCFKHPCSTSQGNGMCLDRADPAQPNTCTQGVWVTGNGPKWPCPGDDTILCCVKYQDMINGTTSNPALTATRSTISASTTGETPPASPSGLSGSQIGGIVGGVVGAALLLALTVLFWFFRRKKRAGENAAPDVNAVPEWPPMSPATAGDADHHNQHMLDGTVLGEMASGDTKKEGLGNCPMIDGNSLTEMDAIANMRHELASSGTPVLHELSGSTVDRMPEKR